MGRSCITMPHDDVSTINAGLPVHLTQVVQTEGERRLQIMKYGKEDVRTFVWTSFGDPYLASVAETGWVDFIKVITEK